MRRPDNWMNEGAGSEERMDRQGGDVRGRVCLNSLSLQAGPVVHLWMFLYNTPENGQILSRQSGERVFMRLIDRLRNPSRDYSSMPFWFLNGDLNAEEMRRQMRDFEAHGVYGVVLHPRMGMDAGIGYLSPEFFDRLRVAVETAREMDMRIILYDEGMYPSGSACGQVVRDHPEYASRGLALTAVPQTGDSVLCETADGFLVMRRSGGTIRGIHFGEDDGEENAPASADILCPGAVERFIHLTHDRYYAEFGPYFGSTIIGFFTDEPSPLGRCTDRMFPWTPGLEEDIMRAGGDIQGLAALFQGGENRDTRIYREVLVRRERDVYYARLSAWCEGHGIALMGHPEKSDDIEVEREFQIPGQDLVYRWVAPETGDTVGTDSVMGKCSADMARWMNRSRNLNECFGACNRGGIPWYFTGGDMKWFIDYLAVRGVNLFVPHAFYYSLAGARSMERPPDVGPGNIWWPHYRRFADYMRRVSCLMAEADTAPGIAVVCRNRDLHPEAVRPLFETQRSFLYLPESLLDECRQEEGMLILRGRRFAAVYGPEDVFPGVSHHPMEVPADILCQPPQPKLRVAALTDGEDRYFFLVNAGMETLDFQATLPVDGEAGEYRLWENRTRPVRSEKTEGGIRLHVMLEPYGSTLLYVPADGNLSGFAPQEDPPAACLTEKDFSLVGENPSGQTRTYLAHIGQVAGDTMIRVTAEEMTEAYVNGVFADAAFWNPQVMRIPAAMLDREDNEVRLVVTGNRANAYGHSVPYGLGLAN